MLCKPAALGETQILSSAYTEYDINLSLGDMMILLIQTIISKEQIPEIHVNLFVT